MVDLATCLAGATKWIAEEIVKMAVKEITIECLKTHKDDIQQVVKMVGEQATKKFEEMGCRLDDIQQAVNTAVEQGWEHDREAGGYSSWGNKTKTA
jgi:hypothetical protein